MPRTTFRRELVLPIGALAAAAIAFSVGGAIVLLAVTSKRTAILATALLAAIVLAGLVVAVARLIDRRVRRPVTEAVEAAHAIAAGTAPTPIDEASASELHELAEAIQRLFANDEARRVERMRTEKLASVGRLAAGLAHEVGNPLGAIQNYAHLLRSRVSHGLEPVEALDGIEREVERIDRIVRGLLDYARPRTPAPTPVDINETAHAAVRLLRDQGALRRAAVELRLDDSAPSVFGERHDAEQMFVNLLLNAVDAMPEGGSVVVYTRRLARAALEQGPMQRAGDPPHAARHRPDDPRVRAWLERVQPPKDLVNVIVADGGTGITPSDRERIFEPFFTTKEPGKGTGLGLAIVSRVVENLQGIVWVERAREGGAAFHMLFPVALTGETAG